MAGAGYKLFATKEVLTARDLNNYLQEQSVMVFASTAARDSALTSVLAEGMVCYVEDNGASVAEFQVYDGAAWQVVWAEGGHPGSGGGGGSFDGEHVLTGDPAAPPDDLDVGQLLWDGVEGSSGGSGGGPHDHDDYLPLTGGTLTGELTVEDRLTLGSETGDPLMLVNRGETRVGYFGVPGAQAGIDGELWLRGDKALILQGVDGVRLFQSDLTVDGNLLIGGNWDGAYLFNSSASGREYMNVGHNSNGGSLLRLYGGGDDSYAGNAYMHSGGGIAARFDKDQNTKVYGNLTVDGIFTPAGGTAFGIADGIDTRDVLERAEVATMPAPEEAVVDGLTVNEVVTAMLAKIKELSARIEELEGN